MDMSGEQRLSAPREQVYAALNDPEILRQAIPGCEEIEKLSDTELTAKVVAKVGPVKAKFQGHVTLSDLRPPEGYTISGEGKGGPAGFAKGSAKVALAEDGAGTPVVVESIDPETGHPGHLEREVSLQELLVILALLVVHDVVNQLMNLLMLHGGQVDTSNIAVHPDHRG